MTGPTLHINDRKQIKRMKSLICLALLFLALSVRGQGITLTGNVRDGKDQLALQDVNVVISSQGHKDITAYTISDQKGSFRLTYTPAKDKEYVIRFSYLGYETVVLNIEKSITQYNVALHAQAIDIKEIIVKAPKIKSQGDTIIYNVASFSKEGDKTIGDVLKKLPGVRVEENGQISYQGTAINKFYIEGMDLLGGKYNIATNNISNDDVGSVEIMENHQPIKALNGLSISEQAAINLRLKEKAKQKWIGSLKGGGGFTPSSGLWAVEMIAMHFNKNFQSCFDEEAMALIQSGISPIRFPNLHLAISSDESKAINFDSTPKVIISASGMCEAGRIKHHLKHNLWRPECTVLFVGYQAYGTLGRALTEGAEYVKLFGETIEVKAELAQLDGVSGHADKNGLLHWVEAFSPKPQMVFVVHGEDETCDHFAECLTDEHQIPACAPFSGALFDLATGEWIKEGLKIPVAAEKPAAKRKSDIYARLIEAGKRLMQVIYHNEGGANKDLAKFISQINSLCDKWDR